MAQKIVNWVMTADGCVQAINTTPLHFAVMAYTPLQVAIPLVSN